MVGMNEIIFKPGCMTEMIRFDSHQLDSGSLIRLSFYPYFLSYTSEYNPDRDQGWRLLVDSSLDWGQGLIALREFMREEGIERVYLSYFGSAHPSAYGIEYVPLESFFMLPPAAAPELAPEFIAISATNLAGVYIEGRLDAMREIEPYRVLAHSIFVYRIQTEDAD
jgi:hypothetical protein